MNKVLLSILFGGLASSLLATSNFQLLSLQFNSVNNLKTTETDTLVKEIHKIRQTDKEKIFKKFKSEMRREDGGDWNRKN